MPHMIPNAVSSDTKSDTERKLFMKMVEMENTDDWYVLHSVGIADHPTQSQGEADFVVIIPGGGIFTLEVKGGQIAFDGNKWTSTNFYGETFEIHDPIKEASDAGQAFKDFLKENAPGMERLMYGFGVVFLDTEVHGKVVFPDLDDDQIADESDKKDIRKYLMKLSKYWQNAFAKTRFTPVRPNSTQCAEVAKLLRPTFETNFSPAAEMRSLEQDIIRLTERQATVFEGILENDRVWVKGGAGTGKTLLALRYAEQKAAEGLKVGVFCYNLQLAEFLKKETAGNENIYAESFTEYMEQTALPLYREEMEQAKAADAGEYYKKKLPEFFENAFLEGNVSQFDVLVLDEAQDIITRDYTDALDLVLKGGLKDGLWCVFMDSDQDLYHKYSRTVPGIDTYFKKYDSYFTRFKLKENCRNSMAIARTVDEIFGMDEKPLARDEYGQEVKFVPYDSKDGQEKALREQINTLLADGIKPSDIVILSPNVYKSSVASRLENVCTNRQEARKQNRIFFSTIAGFKGMESPAVIIVDSEQKSLAVDAQLLYVGMTRARGILTVNLSQKAWEYLEKHKGSVLNKAE